VFLFGGNDANNLIAPIASKDSANTQNPRRTSARAGEAAAVTPPSMVRHLDFIPNLAEVKSLFNQGQLALLANVGTLIVPRRGDQYLHRRWRLPEPLLSSIQQTADARTRPSTSCRRWVGREGWQTKSKIYLGGIFQLDFAGREQRICRGTGSPADRIERGSHASARGLLRVGGRQDRLAALQICSP